MILRIIFEIRGSLLTAKSRLLIKTAVDVLKSNVVWYILDKSYLASIIVEAGWLGLRRRLLVLKNFVDCGLVI